jgi:hypothetical protein
MEGITLNDFTQLYLCNVQRIRPFTSRPSLFAQEWHTPVQEAGSQGQGEVFSTCCDIRVVPVFVIPPWKVCMIPAYGD